MQGVTLLLSRTSCAPGNGRFWNIHRTRTMSLCDYDLFVKVKESLRGTRFNRRDKFIRVIGRWIQNINKDGRTDGVRRLPNIWKKVINKECDCIEDTYYIYCIPVNKVMSEISNCCHYFLSNPYIFFTLKVSRILSILYNIIRM